MKYDCKWLFSSFFSRGAGQVPMNFGGHAKKCLITTEMSEDGWGVTNLGSLD